MKTDPAFGLEAAAPGTAISTGQKLEKLAFTFCKVATVALLAGRFTLPVAAGLASVLYVAAFLKGKRDTQCWVHVPLLIAGFWAFICICSIAIIIEPQWSRYFLFWR